MGNLFRCEVGKKDPEIFFSGGHQFVGGTVFELPKVVVQIGNAQVKIEPPRSGKARIYVHTGCYGGWELRLQSDEFALDHYVNSSSIYEFETYLEMYNEYYIGVWNPYDNNDIVSISATIIYI